MQKELAKDQQKILMAQIYEESRQKLEEERIKKVFFELDEDDGGETVVSHDFAGRSFQKLFNSCQNLRIH